MRYAVWILVVLFFASCGIKITLERSDKVIIEGPKHKDNDKEKDKDDQSP